MRPYSILPILACLLLAACATSAPAATAAALPATSAPASPPSIEPPNQPATNQLTSPQPPNLPSTQPANLTPTPDTRLDPSRWQSWPVVPTLSAAARQIYQNGLALGSDPHRFSTVGDCQSAPNVFLGIYATDRYWLGKDYGFLQEVIDFYQGSFDHTSASVRDGLSAPSALTPMWADRKVCDPAEDPVSCELRLYHPALVFVNLGTNWRAGASAEAYGGYLRRIVERLIAGGALPILSTKADNVEGDNSLNRMTAQIAHDYDIPLWNLWLAVQDLPHHGLDPERKDVYLSTEAWDRRNFTALQTLDALWREVK
ncbi:MAG TPA: SGNH/GDSL hydrolase family protein [Anaerolineales bacterium]